MEITPAILLRKAPWSETSLIVTWLTERFGAIRTMARAARKPGSSFAGKLDVFFRTDISFTLSRKGDLHALREVEVLTVFNAASAGSAGFYLAAYFAELAGNVAPAMVPSPEIYDLLKRGIEYVQRTPATEKAMEHFERELCRILGVHDDSGKLTSAGALASLGGGIPRSRQAALSFLARKTDAS